MNWRNVKKFGLLIIIPIVPSLLANILSEPIRNWFQSDVLLAGISGIKIYHLAILLFLLYLSGVIGYCIRIIQHYRALKAEKKKITRKEGIQLWLNKIVKDTDFIQSAQIYYYRPNCHKGNEVFQFWFYCGSYDNNICINAILQDYYYLPMNIYKQYKAIADSFNQCMDLEATAYQEAFDKYKKNAEPLMNSLETELLEDESINEIKSSKYRLFHALKSNIMKGIQLYVLPDTHREYEKKLIAYQRTGLLSSVFFQNARYFSNSSGHSKDGRVYMTCQFDQLNTHCVLLFAIDGTVLDEETSISQIEEKKKKSLESTFNQVFETRDMD